MKNIITLMALVVALALPYSQALAEPALFKTCYDAIGIHASENDSENSGIERSLYVIIDESVGFDANIIGRVADMVVEWSEPGRNIEIFRFSSNVEGRYSEKILEAPYPPEADEDFLDGIKRSMREKLGRCQKQRPMQLRSIIKRKILSTLESADKSIPKSDIVATISELSRYINGKEQESKSVLIVSDMFENSSITSFYSKGSIRMLNAENEIKTMEKNNMMAEFGGADIYVVGLGYFTGNAHATSERYLDPKRRSPIINFWKQYFSKSNGNVVEIGAPLMHGVIK